MGKPKKEKGILSQCWCFTIWRKNENKESENYLKEWIPLTKKPCDVQYVAWQMEKGMVAKKNEQAREALMKATGKASDVKLDIKGITHKIKNGKVHYQGYIQFYMPRGLKAVKNALRCDWANVRPARGTDVQNQAYITKLETSITGTFRSLGERVANQGKRNDWKDIIESINNGASVHDIINQFPSKLICIAALEKYHKLTEIKANKYKPFKKKRSGNIIW